MWRGIPFLLVAAGAALLPLLAPGWVAPASVVLIFILVGAAASLEFGWAGLPDFANAAWLFAGAWCTAGSMHTLALPFWACVPLSATAITVIALAITSPLLRLPREAFAIVTLAIALIVPSILAHQKLFAVPPTAIPAANMAELYDVMIALLLLAGAGAVLMEPSPLGLAMRARAEDGVVCASIGLNTRRYRLLAIAISVCTATTAGSMLPALQWTFHPANGGFGGIATVSAIAIIAGRRMSGAVIPALIIAGIPQFFPALSDSRVLLAGGAILCCAAWKVMTPSHRGRAVLESINLAQPTGAGAE
jgi:branched-chain amino acid transport system permease protein